jgi:hypothetical protein
VKIILLTVLFIGISFFAYPQNTTSSKKDSLKDTIHKIKIDPDLHKIPFDDCKKTNVFIRSDSVVQEITYLRRNFTDQFLEICATSQLIPASRIYGFSLDNKFYRSAHTHDYCYVFAERIVKGNTSLYYCRNIPMENGLIEYVSSDSKNPGYTNKMIVEEETPKRYANDFSYFITPKIDTTKMIYVTNKNIGEIAKTYFSDCKPAYNDAINYSQKKSTAQKITLPIAFVGLSYLWIINKNPYYKSTNIKTAILSVSMVSIVTYMYCRIKAKNRYLHPNDMIRIITKYNNC